ncbi:lytic transglycosylase domain-containing protein [Blastococcus capsensis]|uniref:aggregation-promoting factor C-terminal-like domain-containing protein n=1 Tax=Blastococcus capsensis TaxID=1564163 RepID=UPI00254111E0|nr:lytic transglycosylase domain-containing protein [Blastococcus capsensis]MDK3257615.1 lytic transglycosylase domain-containing protein [Blastococcus capsensis]
MNLPVTSIARALRPTAGRRRVPGPARRAGLLLAVAAAGGLVAGVVVADEPAAHAEPRLASVSVAEQLGIPAGAPADVAEVADTAAESLERLAASRSERAAEQTAAAQARAAAEQAELDRRAAEEAARIAAEEAARQAAEEAARQEAARQEAARQEAARQEAARQEAARQEGARQAAEEAARQAAARQAEAAARPSRAAAAPAAPTAPSGSYQGYAMQQLGGSGSEFGCLEKLWGKESGWNPDAQNPRSTAYGIPQFLDSTWAGTGIAKTSDGYRQIDAGLIYIENRYGSPCGAWAHSQNKGWY